LRGAVSDCADDCARNCAETNALRFDSAIGSTDVGVDGKVSALALTSRRGIQ